MNEIAGGFYFRIEPEFGIPFFQIYERRVNKRWYQREFVRVGEMGLVRYEKGETPMVAAKRVLNEYRKREARERRHLQVHRLHQDC